MTRIGLVSFAAAAALALTACSGSDGGGEGSTGASGDPVDGGTMRIVQVSDPRSLDPTAMVNASTSQPLVGNSLYGTLVVDDPETGFFKPSMTDWSTPDGGTTWEVEIQPDIMFSDGTPLDAEAIVYNFKRHQDPANGSTYAAIAQHITKFDVKDPQHLTITLDAPNAWYPHGLTPTSLNWVASPTALAKGRDAFDKAPVGAGPFLLDEWRRGASMTFKRNPDFWTDGKPHLDEFTMTLGVDPAQRVNTLRSGGADLVLGSDVTASADAEAAGLNVVRQVVNGGQTGPMLTSKPPFDDIRAREAFSKAIDPEQVNQAVYDGKATVIDSLFSEGTPFHTDEVLPEYDPDRAQELFDELAAEGKPLDFTLLVSTGGSAPEIAEAIQAQIRSYDNVEMDVETVDAATQIGRVVSGGFQATLSGVSFNDPEAAVFEWYHSGGLFNLSQIKDPTIDETLETGRTESEEAARKEGYTAFEKRAKELYLNLWLFRGDTSVYTSDDVGGVSFYGLGSLIPEDLWISK